MSKKKISDSFWLSYSDLLTSLFFIMLLLFVISLVSVKITQNNLRDCMSEVDSLMKIKTNDVELNNKIKELEKSKINLIDSLDKMKVAHGKLIDKLYDYEKILQLERQFKELSASNTLTYDEEHKTFIAKDLVGIEIFKPEDDEIKDYYLKTVDKVGKDLEILLRTLNSSNPDYSYLLVIEGYSANDGTMSQDRTYNYKLSYDRALALYNRWRNEGQINLRKYNTEILICGSGLNGINRDSKVEANNKRFVIQILPKIRKFEGTKLN